MSDTLVAEPVQLSLEQSLSAAEDKFIRGDSRGALAIWAELRRKFPDNAIAYQRAASVLSKLSRHDEAEAVVRTGRERFAENLGFAIESAWTAHARGDYDEAVRRWQNVRERHPDVAAGFTGAAISLRAARRFDHAEEILTGAAEKFLDEPGVAIERAWLAHHRQNWSEAANRWEAVRTRFPDHVVGYTAGAVALRDAKRFEEAESLLQKAMALFPNAPAPLNEHAWLATVRRDWPEAAERWQLVREQFPQEQAAYTAGATALRESGRAEEADILLRTATDLFPNSIAPVREHAWIATAQRDWPEAARRWEAVRERFPESDEAYLRIAQALSEMHQYKEAEALLADAMQRFPRSSGLFCEHASIALKERRQEEAAERYARVRELFPNVNSGYIGGAYCLRDAVQLDKAEELLERGLTLVPDDPVILLEHAQIPAMRYVREERDYDEALRRLESLRRKFPDFGEAYAFAIRVMRDAGRTAEAETFGEEAVRKLPQSYMIAIEHAQTARTLVNWPDALRRYADATEKFPHQPHAAIGLANALSSTGKHVQAEALLREVITRFPTEKAAYSEYASIAVRRSDDKEALARWKEASRRFPGEAEFAQRVFNAQLQLDQSEQQASAEDSHAAAERPRSGGGPADESLAANGEISSRDLVMNFESLGGKGHGCEFGIFQRSQGAEPLGLLRWADLPPEHLADALERRFDGVGLPEHTSIFVPQGAEEYWSSDTRFLMTMRSFIRTSEVTLEQVTKLIQKRLKFLRTKLIEDLEQGAKIFVYKNMFRNLTEEELARLHKAVSAYGNNTLFYVRYERPDRPHGTVEVTAPGLMIGYINHFAFSPEDKPLGAATEGWLGLCRRAYQTWPEAQSQIAS